MPHKKKESSVASKRQVAKASALTDAFSMAVFADVEGENQESFASTSRRQETLDSPAQSFPNIDNCISPFIEGAGARTVNTNEAIRLSVKAYWAFPLLRNIVEVMGELANSRLILKGSNKRTRDFIEQWFEKINIWGLKEQFFREWFRSANFFCYRMDGEFTSRDLEDLQSAFGSSIKKKIPLKYVTLNPEQISVSSYSFGNPSFYKTLSHFELDRINNPKTPAEKETAKKLRPLIKDDSSKSVLQLDPNNLSALMYKAQDYEPMGVPFAYGVLKDIEAKMELKRIDLSIARTTDRALLLITVGETPNQFTRQGNNINLNTLQAIQQAFQNEGIARTLITDYTVKGDWLMPDINKILGDEKYKQLDKDISVGLNAVIFDSGEAFANTSIKVQLFVERLKEARNAFLKHFLEPEIRRVVSVIGAKSAPEVRFEELSLRDELQYSKLAVQMAQVGLLTADELFETLDSGKLPTPESSLESQASFKEARDKGLYLPLLGGASQIQKEQLAVQEKQIDAGIAAAAAAPASPKAPKPAGRPSGSTGPKATTTPTAKASVGFSLVKFSELAKAVSDVQNKTEKALMKKFGIKTLNDVQNSAAKSIVSAIISNEDEKNWEANIKEYVQNPKEIQTAIASQLDDLRIQYDIDEYTAAITRLAKI